MNKLLNCFDMCVNPIKIKNRSSHFDENQPLYFTVPCGKCYECLKAKRNEWFVRCYYEWKEADKAFFYTLTFNNVNLPTFMGLPCFDKRYVQLFLKRLRERLSRYDLKLKYLITSEYGERYGRPHYHAIFYLYGKFNINSYFFYRLVEESWQYGFVKAGDNLGLIDSYKGIQYVVKYVTKDYTHADDFFDKLCRPIYHRYNKLLIYIESRWKRNLTFSLFLDVEQRRFYLRSFAGEQLNDSHPEYDFLQKFITKVRSVLKSRMPFHIQSTKLGYNYALQEKQRLMLDNKVFAPSNKQILPYALPRAWKRLFYYDCIENERDGKRNLFKLNELGKQHYLSNLSANVENKYSDLLNVQINSQYIDNSCLISVNSAFKGRKRFCFDSLHDLVSFVNQCDANLHTLAVYMQVFRFRLIPPEMINVDLTQKVVSDNYNSYAEYCLTQLPFYDYGKIYDLYQSLPKEQAFTLLMWNVHPFFVMYEQLAVVFETISNHLKGLKADADFEKERLTRTIREYFNKT